LKWESLRLTACAGAPREVALNPGLNGFKNTLATGFKRVTQAKDAGAWFLIIVPVEYSPTVFKLFGA
jgi:hypothetical protein